MAGMVMIIIFLFHQIFSTVSPLQLNKLNSPDLQIFHRSQTTNAENRTKLPKTFWSNSGLCPPSPINQSSQFYLSHDIVVNFQIIGSLPNHGVSHMRSHWIFETENFTEIEMYLNLLKLSNLSPAIELMSTKVERDSWEEFVYNFLMRVGSKYDDLSDWNFETWNEPDLRGYNLLNFTTTEYTSYVISIVKGFERYREVYPLYNYKLRGPAGLFKNEKTHKFCWGILERCNESPENCPFDEITFHRKGESEDAHEIVRGGIDLITEMMDRFPNLRHVPYSNTEADPIAGWSTPHEFYSDVRYAATTVNNVLLHLRAKFTGGLPNMTSISHDNSFLSYHPFEFTQRTLLARFQMNQTTPPHVQFIQKPVYAALGMLGSMGDFIDSLIEDNAKNFIHMTTTSDKFTSTIISSLDSSIGSQIPIHIRVSSKPDTNLFGLIVEVLNNQTDPFTIWKRYGSPSYPDRSVRKRMRNAQTPQIYRKESVVESKILQIDVPPPFVILIRVCSPDVETPARPTGLRATKIFKRIELLLSWTELVTPARCIKSYLVYFRPLNFPSWQCLTCRQHLPFLSYHHDSRRGDFTGYYRVRSVDIFDRKSKFSEILVVN